MSELESDLGRSELSGRKIGWVGTGVMGLSMARRLMDAGVELAVTTRTRERAAPLEEAGARWVDRPADLMPICDAVLVMVGYPHDVEQVFLGEQGLLGPGVPPGAVRLLADMTTSSPKLARRIADVAAERGIVAIDAPVSGGDIGAREGKLSIMIGGSDAGFLAAAELFSPLARTAVHQGPAGSGQHTKMVNQILIATNMVGMCEGLRYAEKSGLDPARVLESVSVGAAGSWSIDNLAPRILRGDFEPGFFIEHFIKDLGIALAEAAELKLDLPGLELAHDLYRKAAEAGLDRKGTQALYKVVG